MEKPQQDNSIVFACAGCSHAAQVAYKLALALDEEGIAEMSCLAGVAAEKPSFLRKIHNRKIWPLMVAQLNVLKGFSINSAL